MNSNSVEIAMVSLKTAESEVSRLIREEASASNTKKDLRECRNKIRSIGEFLKPFYIMYEAQRLDLIHR